jgi:hypothetical protein
VNPSRRSKWSWGKLTFVCLPLALSAPWLAALAWGCADAIGPVLGDTPSPPSVDASPGETDAGLDASCTGDLSNIGTGDFHISCTVTSTQTPIVALANQRSTCFYSDMWDLRMEAGVPVIELDDDAGLPHYTRLWSVGHPIDDGHPHALLVERVSGILSINVDGIRTASTAAPASLGSLPPLIVGNDICVGVDGTVLLTSALANLCIGKQ